MCCIIFYKLSIYKRFVSFDIYVDYKRKIIF